MYGKVFRQMYKGTLAMVGPWEAVVTFQQLIILAERDGIVDMTADAISRETTIPVEIIKKGIEALEKPDPESRSPDEEGRRIVRLADNRSWGWKIVNKEKYDKIKSDEDRREYQRQYWREKRSPNAPKKETSTPLNTPQQPSTESNHIDLALDLPVDISKSRAKEKTRAMTAHEKEIIFQNNLNIALPDFIGRQVWQDYVHHRKEIKKPMTERAAYLMVKELERCYYLGHDIVRLMENSIRNGWQGLVVPDVPEMQAKPVGKRLTAIQMLQGAKNGLDEKRTDDGIPKAALLEYGQDSGSRADYGNR